MARCTEPCSFERKVVRHCAPTLAGIKPAGLFTCPQSYGSLEPSIESCRDCLLRHGVSVEVMAVRRTSTLVLVCRRKLVAQTLEHPGTRRYLETLGYEPDCLDACFAMLKSRIACSDRCPCRARSFPHEIGFFLGYPFEDVVTFIENRDARCSACGCWKAYSDAQEACERFRSYKSCTAAYVRMYDEGTSIGHLAASPPAA